MFKHSRTYRRFRAAANGPPRHILCQGSRRADNGVLCQARVPGHLLRRRRADRPDDAREICRTRGRTGQAGTELRRRRLPRIRRRLHFAVDDQRRPLRGHHRSRREVGCDLIFMASHGRRGISSLLLGSETNKVLTHRRFRSSSTAECAPAEQFSPPASAGKGRMRATLQPPPRRPPQITSPSSRPMK